VNLPVEVVEAVSEGRCVLFVGSRLSGEAAEAVGQSYPDNRALAKDLGWKRPKRLPGTMPGSRRNQKTVLPSVAQAAESWRATHGHAALQARLRLSVGVDGVVPSEAHELALRRFPLIFTTNWDDMVERAATAHGLSLEVRGREDLVPADLDPAAPVLYRMRGGFDDPAGIVVAPSDYQARALSDATRKVLRRLIRKKVVFFVGYRPDEEEFELLWAELSACYGGELPRCHLAVAQGKVDDYLWQKWVWRGLLLFTADPLEALQTLEKRLAESTGEPGATGS